MSLFHTRRWLSTGLLATFVLTGIAANSGNAAPTVRSQSLDLNFLPMAFQPEADLTNVALGYTRRYEDVANVGGTKIDARVTVVALSGLDGNVLNTLDEYDNGINLSAHTKPAGAAEASAQLRIDFLLDNTNSPITVNNVSMSIADIDAHEFASFTGIDGYKLATGTQISATVTGGTTRFTSSTTGSSSTDELRIVQATYSSASAIAVSFGCRANAMTAVGGIGTGGRCGFTVPIGNFVWSSGSSTNAVVRPSYSISYHANQGTSGTAPSSTAGTGELTIEGNSGSLSKGSESFIGWNSIANGTGLGFEAGSSIVPIENMTVYAQYGHIVTYDNNGGTGTMALQSGNSAASLTSNSFTRSGYTFGGWNTAQDGSGVSYVDGVSYGFTANLNLFAQWTLVSTTTIAASTANLAASTTTIALPVATTTVVARPDTSDLSELPATGGKAPWTIVWFLLVCGLFLRRLAKS